MTEIMGVRDLPVPPLGAMKARGDEVSAASDITHGLFSPPVPSVCTRTGATKGGGKPAAIFNDGIDKEEVDEENYAGDNVDGDVGLRPHRRKQQVGAMWKENGTVGEVLEVFFSPVEGEMVVVGRGRGRGHVVVGEVRRSARIGAGFAEMESARHVLDIMPVVQGREEWVAAMRDGIGEAPGSEGRLNGAVARFDLGGGSAAGSAAGVAMQLRGSSREVPWAEMQAMTGPGLRSAAESGGDRVDAWSCV